MSLTILGTGSAMPEKRLTNEELTHMVDTSDEWIVTRTGIHERRVITTETLSSLGAKALSLALENAGCAPGELEMILCTTVRGDTATPALANMIERELGINCPGIDLNGACAGFIAALDVADAYLTAGRVKRMAIVGAEALSFLTDWTDRSTCVLFGDGAGAVVLGPGNGLNDLMLTAKPSEEWLVADAPKGNSPFFQGRPQHPYLTMNGQEVYKFAVSSITRDIRAMLKNNGLEAGQVDWYLLHQANLRIIEAARARLKQSREKFPTTIERYGNISSASIPVLMDEMNRQGLLKEGQRIMMSAFGAGLTTGAALMTWRK